VHQADGKQRRILRRPRSTPHRTGVRYRHRIGPPHAHGPRGHRGPQLGRVDEGAGPQLLAPQAAHPLCGRRDDRDLGGVGVGRDEHQDLAAPLAGNPQRAGDDVHGHPVRRPGCLGGVGAGENTRSAVADGADQGTVDGHGPGHAGLGGHLPPLLERNDDGGDPGNGGRSRIRGAVAGRLSRGGDHRGPLRLAVYACVGARTGDVIGDSVVRACQRCGAARGRDRDVLAYRAEQVRIDIELECRLGLDPVGGRRRTRWEHLSDLVRRQRHFRDQIPNFPELPRLPVREQPQHRHHELVPRRE